MLQCSDDISVVRVLFVAEPAMVEPTVTTSLDWTQTQLGWSLMHNTGHLLRLHSLCIPQGGEEMIVWGVLKFFEEKRGYGENFWRQESWMPIYLDAIERLSIYNIVGKTPLVQWKMFLLSFTFCNNQLYPHYHYHLYIFIPLLLITSRIVFILIVIIFVIMIIIVIITVIVIKIKPPLLLSKHLKLW